MLDCERQHRRALVFNSKFAASVAAAAEQLKYQ